MFAQSFRQFDRRRRQLHQIWQSEGKDGISSRARRVLASWLEPKNRVLPVLAADVMATDLDRPRKIRTPKARPGEAIRVNWVVTPATPGSGGHTTIYRIINYLEKHGYRNRVYFYDVHGSDHQYYERATRDYYGFEGDIARAENGIEDAHAIVATSWPTAYPVYNADAAGKRFYFVQDFEPYFYPIGAESVLADSTYRMGFHAITAGRWLAEKLSLEYGMTADAFEFGCDTSRYRRLSASPRSGVAFYARPGATRRGYEIGILALELFAREHPHIDLHLYGGSPGKLPFQFIDHGLVSPEQLNAIYNVCRAGLSLSLTNVSLVPHEMLAAGCIPVVNDAHHNRIVLDNAFVRYAAITPHTLAAELGRLVSMPDFDTLSLAAANSVRSARWEDAGSAVDSALRRAICE